MEKRKSSLIHREASSIEPGISSLLDSSIQQAINGTGLANEFGSPPQSPVSILANSGSVPNGVLDRPRKKLSFREPEILGTLKPDPWTEFGPLKQKTLLNDTADEDLLESQAMKIVRTVGQAFDARHKVPGRKTGLSSSVKQNDNLTNNNKDSNGESWDPRREGILNHIPESSKLTSSSWLVLQHEALLLKQQLEQQQQQTSAALAEIKLLSDQLAAETAARLEAQAQTQQLMLHNKQLLQHIQHLVLQMQHLEQRLTLDESETNSLESQFTGLQLNGNPHRPPTTVDNYNPTTRIFHQQLLPTYSLCSSNNNTLKSSAGPAFILPLAEPDIESPVTRPEPESNRSTNPDPVVMQRRSGAQIMRSISERTAHRNEAMEKVQRTYWARHSAK